MIRFMLLAGSGLALLIGFLTVALCARSYWCEDRLTCEDFQDSKSLIVGSDAGAVRIGRASKRVVREGSSQWNRETRYWGRPNRHMRPFDLYFLASDGWRERAVIFPHWSLATILIALSAGLYWQARLARDSARLRMNLCRICEYDLRASPDRCPECGTPVKWSISTWARVATRGTWAIATLFFVVTAWGAWWINPRRGAPTIASLASDYGMGFRPVWEPNRRDGINRMHRVDPAWDEHWYQALIRQPEGDRLVVVYWGYLPGQQGLRQQILMFDASLHIVRTGTANSPVELIEEVKAEGNANPEGFRIPVALRGQWCLVIDEPSSPEPTWPDTGRGTQSWIQWDEAPSMPINAAWSVGIRPSRPVEVTAGQSP